MPVFATRTGFLHYLFSDMRRLDKRQRLLIAFLLFLGFLTPTLYFFSFDSPGFGHVRWTGLDVMYCMLRGVPPQPLPKLHSWAEAGRFGVWDPLYFVAFLTAYVSLGISGFAVAFQPLRRLFRLTGTVGVFAAYWCVGRSSTEPFNDFIVGIRSGWGPVMLGIILVLMWLIADAKVVPD